MANGMIGGEGLSTLDLMRFMNQAGTGGYGGLGGVREGGGTAIGNAAQSVGMLNTLFGTRNSQSQNQTAASKFDEASIPLFLRELARSRAGRDQLAKLLSEMSGERTAALRKNLDKQIESVQGFGQQEIADVNRRYNSRQGAVGQNLASRGLYNSTIAPGMSALVERERNQALGQARQRQQQYVGGILGQQAQLLDRAAASKQADLSRLGFADYGLQSMLPQQIANNRVTSSSGTTRQKSKGLFSRLF